tara:strand:+ start:462 stop:611 length:150 start_codon:yes stop_codon:yes gene_type:complete
MNVEELMQLMDERDVTAARVWKLENELSIAVKRLNELNKQIKNYADVIE